MRVGSVGSGSLDALDDLPVDVQIDAELMSQDLEAQREEGAAQLKLIESAAVGVNQPLLEGPIGRRINIRI